MASVIDKLAAAWPREGVLASPHVQRLLFGGALTLLLAVPLTWGRSFRAGLANMLLAGAFVLVGGIYLARNERQAYRRARDLAMLAVLVVGGVYGSWAHALLAPDVTPFVLPLPLGAILATLLVSPQAGMVVGAASVGAGVMTGVLEGPAVFAALLVNAAGVTAMSQIKERSRLVAASGSIVASMSIAAAAVALGEGAGLVAVIEWAAAGAVGGFVTVVATLGLLAVFEPVFGVTSDVRLLELANPGAPLLRRLMLEAPGTYTHAILTGNLAEAAAEAIGADPLLARVGAYYHDIGKLMRPAFFVENQAGCVNPHENTSPTLSALIITAHVREGVELAEQYRLPSEIVDIIRQHHGTSVVSYFYRKAASQGEPVVEADFRYSGELPSGREAAIVMLADAAEAAVRAITKPTPPRIEECVRRVLDSKLADHQLDAADLTFVDMERIIKVYTRMLSGLYHPRVEYPSTVPEGERHVGERHEPSRA